MRSNHRCEGRGGQAGRDVPSSTLKCAVTFHGGACAAGLRPCLRTRVCISIAAQAAAKCRRLPQSRAKAAFVQNIFPRRAERGAERKRRMTTPDPFDRAGCGAAALVQLPPFERANG